MSEAVASDGQHPFAATDLRARIGWICHALRIAAAGWGVWVLAMVLVMWSNKAAILSVYEQWLALDLSGVSDLCYGVAVAVVLLDCTAVVIVVVCLWRLFGTYLKGRVFAVEASIWLRRTGLAGMLAVVVDVLARLAIVAVLSGHFILVPPRGSFLLPQDLLHLIFAVFVFALAYIFKAASEMAEDHAQIV
jgi:Protein of unknown function (DUF2975)